MQRRHHNFMCFLDQLHGWKLQIGLVKTWDVSPSILKTVSVSSQKADGGQHPKRDTKPNARAPSFAIPNPHTNLLPTQTELRDLDQRLATHNPSPGNFREWKYPRLVKNGYEGGGGGADDLGDGVSVQAFLRATNSKATQSAARG